MDEQKTLTLDFIKSLMEPAYTLVWTDYDDNLDNHRGLIQNALTARAVSICGKRQTCGTAMPNGRLSVESSRN